MKKLNALHRARLKDRLKLCTDPERKVFVQMYGPKECLTDKFMFDANQIAKNNMDHVVDKMRDDQLDWALKQVGKTLAEKNRE